MESKHHQTFLPLERWWSNFLIFKKLRTCWCFWLVKSAEMERKRVIWFLRVFREKWDKRGELVLGVNEGEFSYLVEGFWGWRRIRVMAGHRPIPHVYKKIVFVKIILYWYNYSSSFINCKIIEVTTLKHIRKLW